MLVGGLTKTRRVMCQHTGCTGTTSWNGVQLETWRPGTTSRLCQCPAGGQGGILEWVGHFLHRFSQPGLLPNVLGSDWQCVSTTKARKGWGMIMTPGLCFRGCLLQECSFPWSLTGTPTYPLIPNSSHPSLTVFPDPSFVLPQSLPTFLSVMNFRQIISYKNV